MNFNFVARGKKSVESYNQFWVAFEEVGYLTNDTWGINAAERKMITKKHISNGILVPVRTGFALRLRGGKTYNVSTQG